VSFQFRFYEKKNETFKDFFLRFFNFFFRFFKKNPRKNSHKKVVPVLEFSLTAKTERITFLSERMDSGKSPIYVFDPATNQTFF